jgi:hypothetical protein
MPKPQIDRASLILDAFAFDGRLSHAGMGMPMEEEA